MEYKIYLTYNAKKMINEHIEFLSKVSIKAAINLKQIFKEYIIILKHFPYLGKKINKKLPTYIGKMVINKRYILIYFLINNKIYIDKILDSRQNNKIKNQKF